MDTPPLVLFSHRVEPETVLELLRQQGEVTLTGTPSDWSSATVAWSTASGNHSVTVNHERDYYAGSEWPKQRQGMAGYFAHQQAPGVLRPEVIRLINSLHFSVSFPDQVLSGQAEGAEALIKAIAKRLDGVFFVPGTLLDADGRVLISHEGEPDPAARLPDNPSAATESVPGGEVDEDEEIEAPDATRVARRALVLAAMSGRALTEKDPGDDIEGFRRDLWQWVCDVGLETELEAHERTLLSCMKGLEQQATLDAVWMVEGLGVLAWALRLVDLPPYDTLVTPMDLWKALRLLKKPQDVLALVAAAELRGEEELQAMGTHQLAFNWRMRDFSIRPQAMDFVAFSKNCWFGSFPLDGFEIADGDLSLGGVEISEADEETRSSASSSSVERHRAINWLRGYAVLYSETDTAT